MKKLIALVLAVVVCLFWYTNSAQIVEPLAPELTEKVMVSEEVRELPELGGVEEGDEREEVAALAEPVALEPVVTISANCVDVDGKPMEGIELVARSIPGEPSAFTNSRGDVELVLLSSAVRNGFQQSALFVVKSPRTVAVSKNTRVSHTEDTFIGRFILEQGGSVEGRVLDWTGAPAVGALVYCSEPVLDRGSEEYRALRVLGSKSISIVATTGGDGRYVIEGVTPSTYTVAAYLPGSMRSMSEPIAVRAWEVARPADLLLEQLPDDSIIRGAVLEADGSPRADVDVYLISDDEQRVPGRTKADAQGEFAFGAIPGTVYTIKAGLPGSDVLYAYDVKTGTLDLVLQPTKRGEFTVQARTPGGESVRSFWVDLRYENGKMPPNGGVSSEDGSPVQVSIPQRDFYVNVITGEHATVRAGPFDPEIVPEVVEAVMVPLPGLTGQVFANGVPVPGARVQAFYSRDHSYVELLGSGLHRIQMYQDPGHTATAHEGGRFLMPMRPDLRIKNGFKRIHLRATAEGYAFGPELVLPLSEILSFPDVVLNVAQPGAMQGQLVFEGERDLRGLSISISRADNQILTKPLDETGAYSFEGLAPGKWQATLLTGELGYSEELRRVKMVSLEDIVWSFEVREGETTRFDLEAEGSERDTVGFEGNLLIDGSTPLGWTWRATQNQSLVGEGRFDADGQFSVTCKKPGMLFLTIVRPLPADSGTSYLWAKTLLNEGLNNWHCELSTGSLVIAGLPEPLGSRDEMVHRAEREAWAVEWKDPGRELTWGTRILCGQEGGLKVSQVPAGEVRISRLEWYEPVADSVRVFDLVAGENLEVDVGE